jgi:hypothetical protein
MSGRKFELSTFVNVDVEAAFQFLSDLNNHRHLHPFFIQAEQVSSGEDIEGNCFIDFIMTERPQLGPFRYTITFPTRMIFTGQHEFRSDVRAALGTHLVNVMKCTGENNGTRVSETVIINAPWMTIGYVKQQAYVAHKRTFDLLPSVLHMDG